MAFDFRVSIGAAFSIIAAQASRQFHRQLTSKSLTMSERASPVERVISALVSFDELFSAARLLSTHRAGQHDFDAVLFFRAPAGLAAT